MAILFVYGTLAPGEENAYIMDGMVGDWHKASIRGHRSQTGWGLLNGHPGLHPDKNGPHVQGLAFISDDLPAHWDRLDAFEGADYKRIPIEAKLDSGETVIAQIYSAICRN